MTKKKRTIHIFKLVNTKLRLVFRSYMMDNTKSMQFSKNGTYFAQISSDGKLKIWETASNIFKQEFTPNLHLTTPCTCLHWVHGRTQALRKKRKRRQSESSSEEATPYIALGTNSGCLYLYSFATAQVEGTINSDTSYPISCITYKENDDVYAGAEQYVLHFDLKENRIKSKWKTGNEKISSILIVCNKSRLLTASKSIKLWDLNTQVIIKSFTGHSSDVCLLNFIPSNTSDPYFISASKNDRILSCWSLNEKSSDKNAVASMLMEDVAMCVSIVESSDNSTNVAAVTRSGVVHIYQHTLNGKCGKPVKPKVTIQVAAEGDELVQPIAVVSALFHEDASLLIVHGNNVVLTFENVMPNPHEKVQCLIRKSPRQILSVKDTEVSKNKELTVDKSVDYLTPHNTTNHVPLKRKSADGKTEVPMEKRLENLTLHRLDSGVPKADNVAQLLVQGLHSKDKRILQNVLCKREENIIKNTVKRLPMQAIVPLLTELSRLIQGKTLASQTGALWLRYLTQIHASQLLANPNFAELVTPILGSIENRLSLLTPIARLRGRLDFLVAQISSTENKDIDTESALIVYKDQGSSDSESDENLELNTHSDTENEWNEDDEEEEDEEEMSNDSSVEEIKENNVSDSEMSM